MVEAAGWDRPGGVSARPPPVAERGGVVRWSAPIPRRERRHFRLVSTFVKRSLRDAAPEQEPGRRARPV